jgi:hypothetical protein
LESSYPRTVRASSVAHSNNVTVCAGSPAAPSWTCLENLRKQVHRPMSAAIASCTRQPNGSIMARACSHEIMRCAMMRRGEGYFFAVIPKGIYISTRGLYRPIASAGKQ